MVEDTIFTRYIWTPEDLAEGLKQVFPKGDFDILVRFFTQVRPGQNL